MMITIDQHAGHRNVELNTPNNTLSQIYALTPFFKNDQMKFEDQTPEEHFIQ